MAYSLGLRTLEGGSLQLRAKHLIPEAAGDTKTIVKVCEVVLKMILFKLLVVHGKTREVNDQRNGPSHERRSFYSLAVMKEVVGHVVADVAEDTATIHCQSSIPIVEEDSMSKLPEWRCQYNKESWGHDQAILVHRQVVMNTVEQEVESQSNTIVRKIAA